jgi:Rad3-related DNA helicase
VGSFFIDNYHHLRFPVRNESTKGFRRAQLGAIFATASHFTQSGERAVIVMPTGSGKTAVLMQLAFLLRATRVLVVTPSVLVRSQITERFSSLEPLRKIGAVAPECPSPTVYEVPGKLRTEDDWCNEPKKLDTKTVKVTEQKQQHAVALTRRLQTQRV